ncbi:MAG TPA: FKBP-type peptidyl-prolyl cis-trans isomerase [Chitinophagaceae bacterium]
MKYPILFICVLASVYASAQTKPKTTTTTSKTTTAKTPVKTTSTAPVLKNALDSFSYAIGMSVGNFCNQQQIKNVNTNLVMRGVSDAGGKPLLTEQQMNAIITGYLTKQSSEKARAVKAQGEKFLAENAKKPGVITTASGLQYMVLRAGTDTTKPAYNDAVVCHYKGTLSDGTEFESSYNSGQPARFKVNEVIAGWIEALQMMPKGSKWRLFIPSNLAYGDQSNAKIPGGSTLIFELELLDIIKQ